MLNKKDGTQIFSRTKKKKTLGEEIWLRTCELRQAHQTSFEGGKGEGGGEGRKEGRKEGMKVKEDK